jgi:hypothetical protein
MKGYTLLQGKIVAKKYKYTEIEKKNSESARIG